MDKEIKQLLKTHIRAVNQSRLKVIVGIVLLTVNVILLLLGLLDTSTLVFTLILLYSLWSVTMDHRINKAVLTLMRYIVDSDFAKRFDEENNN